MKMYAKDSLENAGIILVAPYENLGNGSKGLDQNLLVALCHLIVLYEDTLEVSGKKISFWAE